ncbi:MAG: hypothetical protein N3A69_08305, partial [Leptospiraceae bacterium]|nr:hypothetical protein [Leptospiraceae bacterium]
EKTVENALRYYLNFERETAYEKRIRTEVAHIFNEKKNNRGYFFPAPNQFRLRGLGFNQIIHILIKRLWDEEEFAVISKIPKEIVFLDLEATDVSLARVSLEDALRYVQNLRVLPFVSPETNFFKRKLPEQIKFCLVWLQKGNSVQSFLNRIKLVGAYPQTVFYAGQNLIQIAKEYEKNPTMQITEDEPPSERILEDKANILTRLILSQPLVESGYFKFSETTLKRTILNDAAKALSEKENINYLIEILDKARSNGLKVTEEQVKKTAAKISMEYRKIIGNGNEAIITNIETQEVKEEKPEQSVPNSSSQKTKTLQVDLAHAYDALLYELRNELKKNSSTINLSVIFRSIVNKMKSFYEGISERHLTIIYLYLKDLDKREHSIQDGIHYMRQMSQKFGLSEIEAFTIYFLMQTEKEKQFKEIPLSEFVEFCIREQESLLTQKQIVILRTLFGQLPKEISINHFYQVKEKLKDKTSEVAKKRAIDMLSEYVHVKIAEKKSAWVYEQMLENKLIEA